MECPTCHHELPFRECPECGEETPDFGKYCCHCGVRLAQEPSTIESDEAPDDFSNRVLCSDGSCIGVINKHGFCNECGKPYGEPGESE
jgi:hypothetical protein